VLKADEEDEDAQTWFETDISMEKPIKPPFAGGDMFWNPPLLGSCIGTTVGMGGWGIAGGVRTVLSYASPPPPVGVAAAVEDVAVR
jgi:hypothetical protein